MRLRGYAGSAGLLLLVCAASSAQSTGDITEFSTGLSANSEPFGIVAGPDGNLWFAEYEGNRIGRITTAGVITEFSTGLTAESGPTHIAVGADGNLWFTEYAANRIGRITTAGVITEFFTGLTAASDPYGIVAGPDGNLWFTEYNGSRIGRITTAGVITEFSAGLAAGSYLYGIAAGSDGNLWFTEFAGNRIGRITTGGVITEFSTGLTAKSGPYEIAAGSDGNLWFTEYNANQIGQITTAGVITEFSTGLTAASGLYGIAAGPDGNLWFTERTADKIGRITTAGLITEFSTGLTAASEPAQIVTGPDGNLWFTEYKASQIGRIDSVRNQCDVGLYGVVNVADVQREINEALGVTPSANDLNDDGVVNVVDVQIVIDAALGLGCSAGGATPATLTAAGKPALRSGNPQTTNAALTVTALRPTIRAVVNAASLQSGPISPGEIVTIDGAGLGPPVPAGWMLDRTGKIAASIAGVQVLFGGTSAPLTYVSATQINCAVPYGIQGSVNPSVQVSYQGQTSSLFELTYAATAPALFTANGSGTGHAAAFKQDGSYSSPANPAAKGGILVLFLTGAGETSPAGVTGKITGAPATHPLTAQPVAPVRAWIGGQPAAVAFYGEAPGLVSGVMQLNVQIPSDVPSGNVPISVSVGGNSSPEGVTISVR
jgi:uncharacterized protein (TIGR03437 family)